MINIAVDCMGGDEGARITVPSALKMLDKHADIYFLLIGDSDEIKRFLKKAKPAHQKRFEIIHTTEVVANDDKVEVALRRKKNSSMRVAIDCVKDGRAHACVSAGNTGALMAISRFVLKMLDGIDRPAIATSLPNIKGQGTTVLDLGANVDCSAQHLMEFAIMGSALAQAIDNIESPSVGLLNVGAEAMKGNDVVKETSVLLQRSNLNFKGNVEGNDIFEGTTDVIVCDGFVGNSVLKAIEGVSKMVAKTMKREFKRSFYTKLVAMAAVPVLHKLRLRLDNRRYNGASLLGLRGIVIKSHGGADKFAFGCALERAREAVHNDLLSKIAHNVACMHDSIHSPSEQPEQSSGTTAST